MFLKVFYINCSNIILFDGASMRHLADSTSVRVTVREFSWRALILRSCFASLWYILIPRMPMPEN